MTDIENLPAILPQDTQEVPLQYDSNIGFKDDVKYSQEEFAILWNAMLTGVTPNIEINTDDNSIFMLSTFGLMFKGYACTLDGGIINFDLSNEKDPIIYLWAKINIETDATTFIFNTDGEDLSVNDTDVETNVYLGLFNKISDGKYFWINETKLNKGSKLDDLLKPDVIENLNGFPVGTIITLPKPPHQYTRMIVYGLNETKHINIISEGLLPEEWTTSSSARAYSEWSDGKTLDSYNVLLNRPSGINEDQAQIATATAWRHATIAAKPHVKAYDFKITKIKFYKY